MVKNLAKRAMTTNGQKMRMVIDHLSDALAGELSSTLRRAAVLIDIDQHPGTSQVGIMERLGIHKSALNREIDWLFNYGCIMLKDSAQDARTKEHYVCGFAKKSLDNALGYFDGKHDKLMRFVMNVGDVVGLEKPTLRDMKLISDLYEHKDLPRNTLLANVSMSPSSTDHRAYKKLVEEGVIRDA